MANTLYKPQTFNLQAWIEARRGDEENMRRDLGSYETFRLINRVWCGIFSIIVSVSITVAVIAIRITTQ